MSLKALITGAEQGLGRAIKNKLVTAGFGVTNVSGDQLREAAGKEEVQGLLDFGPWDVVVNNFGINHLATAGLTPAEDEEIIRLNVMAPFWILDRLALDQRLHPTRVLNVASATYRVNQRTTHLYSASKAALVRLTKTFAREMAPKWQVNAIAPGKMEDTEMAQLTDEQVVELRGWTPEEAEAYALKMIPMGRFTSTTEVARAAMAMLTMPPYVTGSVLDVMGGV